jgi:hypothetical protein
LLLRLLFILLVSSKAMALEVRLENTIITLSGKLDMPPAGMKDAETFLKMARDNPQVKTIHLENMPGGSVDVADSIAKFVGLYRLTTVVSGTCASACTRIFMMGDKRQFSNKLPLNETYIGLHGIMQGDKLIDYHDALHTRYLQQARLLDPKILRVMPELKNNEMVYLYHPSLSKKAVGICKQDYFKLKCDFMEGNALSNSVITTEELFKLK